MNIINKIKNNITELVFIYALTVAEVYYILKAIFNSDYSFVLSALAAFVLITATLSLSALSKKISILAYALAGFAAIVVLLFNSNDLLEFFSDALHSLEITSFIESGNPIIISAVLAFIFLLINYIIIKLYHKSIIALVISIALICAIYFSYDYISVVFEIIYMAIVILIFINWLSPKTDDDKNKKSLLSFGFVILAAAIIAPITIGMSHARQEPLMWIDNIDWFENDEATPSTGYIIRIDGQSKITYLSDQFNYSDTEMFIVTSPYIDRLRNKTFDIYTRNGWKKAQDSDALNQGFQFSNYEFVEILNENNIPYTEYEMIVKLSACSQMLFAPLNSSVITDFEEQLNLSPYDELYFDSTLNEEDVYSLSVIKIEYSSAEFLDFINNSSSSNIDNIENYLSISENLKKELRPLVLGLTQDTQTNYQKAKIIESYLSSQFTYNILPPEKPQNEDYITYFLFETQEGFCTHYASSMVMMLRSIDIPCRFVTGYLMNTPAIYSSVPEQYQQFAFVEGSLTEFIINKDDSHAWVEVWFDDYGWLTFEPTSRYQSPLSSGEMQLGEYDFENIELIEDQAESKEKSNLFAILLSVLGSAVFIFIIILVVNSLRRTDRKKSI